MIERRTVTTRDDWQTPLWLLRMWLWFCAARRLTPVDPFPARGEGGAPTVHDGWLLVDDAYAYLCEEDSHARGHGLWCNPPYGTALRRFARLISEWHKRADLVCSLVPARVETRWFRQLAVGSRVIVVPERIRFQGASHGAMFPSALIVGGMDRDAIDEWCALWAGALDITPTPVVVLGDQPAHWKRWRDLPVDLELEAQLGRPATPFDRLTALEVHVSRETPKPKRARKKAKHAD